MEVKDLPQITQSTESDFAVSSTSQKTRLISFKNIFEKISFSSLATKAKNIIGAINELKAEKIKMVAVNDSCVTDTNNSGMQAYPYRGTIWGNKIIAKVDDLKSQGHTILGGTLVSGPLQDAEESQGYGSGHGLILQTGHYNNVPARFTINSTGYQTMRVIVAIFYI